MIGAIIGMVFAALASAIYWKPRLSSAQQALRSAKERHEAAADSAVELKDTFAALASAALKSNNESFLSLAQENLGKFQLQAKVDLDRRQDAIQKMVSPVDETLKQVDKKIEDLERDRLQAQSSLKQQIESLASETSALSTALRRPIVRGRWGEMQLRRVVEIAGMTAYCDFDEQVSVNTDDGRLRPDLVVNLAGGKEIVVDAKVPMEAYLKASETDDPESRSVQLLDHLRQTKDHVNSLARKAYWDQFESTPQLVVMFIPNDAMFIAALDQDPTLMEWAGQKNVFLASPITLIAVLK
ncbi:MAG: DNA recombination protein RmuC, partial [Dehalococcoidia bacterium]|nr:DNA recombination protein RmuC [Dehalococcoidia bacterium]